jgi:predicted nucleic acid-binding protein
MISATPESLIIADASPLIGLVKIDRLGLLRRLARDIWVPQEVWAELIEGGRDRPEAALLATYLAGAVREGDAAVVARFRQQVDPGEAAAVALAVAYPGCLLLIDDAAGRKLAEGEGIRCVGVGGLLLRAKRGGLIRSLAADLTALRAHGYFLSGRVMQQLLVAAGEQAEGG